MYHRSRHGSTGAVQPPGRPVYTGRVESHPKRGFRLKKLTANEADWQKSMQEQCGNPVSDACELQATPSPRPPGSRAAATKHCIRATVAVFAALLLAPLAPSLTAQSHYPGMAPLAQYMMPSPAAEIALARSAAPAPISGAAGIMVLGRDGYTAVAKGSNGFLCLVERSWGAATTDPGFWNPKNRSPICFNPAAARSVVPSYLLKTKLVLAGKSKAEIVHGLAAAFDSGKLPTLELGAMCYMLSPHQAIGPDAELWHPHLMFFVHQPDAAWGANLPGSPVIASPDPEERYTIFMVLVGKWSDGTPAPPLNR